MNAFKRFVVLLTLGLLPILWRGTDVRGAETTLGLITRADDTWELWAWTSSGDNDGITGYRVEMTGTNLTGHHESPMWFYLGTDPPVGDGFVVDREDIPNDTGNVLFAEIPIPQPSAVGYPFSFYGVGSPDLGGRIMASSGVPFLPGVVGTQIPWGIVGFDAGGTSAFFVPDYAVLLASGHGTWRDVNFGGVTAVTVNSPGEWSTASDNRESSEVTLLVTRVPEPRAWITGVILFLFSTLANRTR